MLWLFCKIYEKVVENVGRLQLTEWATLSRHSCCELLRGCQQRMLVEEACSKVLNFLKIHIYICIYELMLT